MNMDAWLTPFENDLLKEIIPYIDSHFAVYTDRDHARWRVCPWARSDPEYRAGSPGNIRLGGGFSSAPDTRMPPSSLVPDPSVPKQLKLIWLGCGNRDGLIRISQASISI